jgi:hypothetical protein
MNLLLIQVPAFLSEQTLRVIREIVAEVLISQNDVDLTLKLTTVQGYAQLIQEDPKNLAYHVALRRATERMVEAMRRKKYDNTELVGRLEEVLS